MNIIGGGFDNLPPGVKPEDCEPDTEWLEETGAEKADRMEL